MSENDELSYVDSTVAVLVLAAEVGTIAVTGFVQEGTVAVLRKSEIKSPTKYDKVIISTFRKFWL